MSNAFQSSSFAWIVLVLAGLGLAAPTVIATQQVAGSVPRTATEAYYRGEYREAVRLLRELPAADAVQGLRLYRIHFALRAIDADPETQRSSFADAHAVLTREFARRPSPVNAHYLGALELASVAEPDRIHQWLDRPPAGWSRFESTKLLQLSAVVGVAPERLQGLITRIVEDPGYFSEPYSDDFLRAVAEVDFPIAERDRLEKRVLAALPDQFESRLSWIGYLIALGREAEARTFLDRLRGDDVSAAARARWSELLHQAGRPGDALALAQSLAQERGTSRDWRRVAQVEAALGHEAEAREAYKKCLQSYPAGVSQRLEFARVLIEQGRQEEAEKNYRRAVALSLEAIGPARSRAQLALALFLENQDRYREALDVARGIPASSPQAANAVRIRARSLWRLGEFDRVLQVTGERIAEGLGEAALWHLRALAFRDRGAKGDLNRALEAMDSALSLAPGVRAYRVQRIELLWSADESDRAIELQQTLLGEDGYDLPGWQRLGRMLAAYPGRLDDAAQAYRKALEFYPQDPELWQRLMETLSQLRSMEQLNRS